MTGIMTARILACAGLWSFPMFFAFSTEHSQQQERVSRLKKETGISRTFSIVAVDPQTGETGAAVASKYPAVGKVVPYV